MQEPSSDRLGKSSSPHGRSGVLCALLVAVASTLPFAGTLGHGFALDDVSEVVRNDHVRSLADVPRLFTEGAWDGAGDTNPIYRPLTSATYALQHALGGPSPFGYHLGNVLLHAIASLLVLALGRRAGLSLAAATFGAALFAVHPLHVEVVANIAGRKDALATALVIAAVLAHDTALRRGPRLVRSSQSSPSPRRSSRRSPAPPPSAPRSRGRSSSIAGRGAKPVREPWRSSPRTPSCSRCTSWRGGRRSGASGSRSSIDPLRREPARARGPRDPVPHGHRRARARPRPPRLPARALARLLLRRDPARPVAARPAFLASAAVLAVIAVAAVRAVRGWPVLAFCAAWYAIGVFPASNLLVKVGTVFGERLLYLPSVGFCLAIAAPRRPRRPGGDGPLERRPARRARGGRRDPPRARRPRPSRTRRSGATRCRCSPRRCARSRGPPRRTGSSGRRSWRSVAWTKASPRSRPRTACSRASPSEHSGSRIELGVAYERQGRLERAERLYEEVLQSACRPARRPLAARRRPLGSGTARGGGAPVGAHDRGRPADTRAR